MQFNEVLIAGNLGADPEIKYTQKGTAVANIRLCVIAKKKKLADGTWEEEVAWVDVEMWEKTAENFVKFHFKGDNVFIKGRLAMDEWNDKTTGQKRSKLKVICDSWHFTSKKGENASQGGGGGGGGRGQQRQRPQQERGQERQGQERGSQNQGRGQRRQEPAPAHHDDEHGDEPFDIGDDDVPF